MIFRIPASNLDTLDKKLAKLSRKAKKLGQPELSTKFIREERDSQKLVWFHLEILGVSPKLPGWTFLGTLEHTEAGNLIKTVPGQSIPETYRDLRPQCDHCKLDRYRKETFVVLHDDGQTFQVGRQCIRDFLGHVTPEQLGFLAQLIRELRDEESGEECSSYGMGGIFIHSYLDQVAAIALKYGFTSKAAAKAYAEKSGGPTLRTTSDYAAQHFSNPNSLPKDFERIEVTEEAKTLASEAFKWIQGIQDHANPFLLNLSILSHKEILRWKDLGMAAAIVATYMREVAKIEIQRKRNQSFAEKFAGSEFFGEPKKRYDLVLTLTKIVPLKDEYGQEHRALYCFEDRNGSQFAWFSSRHVVSLTKSGERSDLREGQTYKVRGTVKAHNVYREVKQTILSRCDLNHELTETKAS